MATTTTAGQASVVTVTVGPTETTGADADLVSSTMSLIYIYSAATTEAQATSTSSSDSSHDLAGGAIAGIVVGCVAFLVLLALGLFCYSRKIARKRRGERAASTIQPLQHSSSRQSSLPTTSRAQSHPAAAVHSPRVVQRVDSDARAGSRHSNSNSHSRINQQHDTRSPRTSRSNRHHPKTPTHGLPTHHELEGSRGQQQPKVHEVYGSYVHPVELQAGSTTNLVAVAEVAQIKKARPATKIVTRSISTSRTPPEGVGGEKDWSDTASTGYLSPTWPPPPSSRGRGGTMSSSETDMDSSTIMSALDMQSIHVYYSPGSEYAGSPAVAEFAQAAALSRRRSQIQIALAMSQAASSSPKSPSKVSYNSTARRGSTLGSVSTMTK